MINGLLLKDYFTLNTKIINVFLLEGQNDNYIIMVNSNLCLSA
jgi:hypothetical protein